MGFGSPTNPQNKSSEMRCFLNSILEVPKNYFLLKDFFGKIYKEASIQQGHNTSTEDSIKLNEMEEVHSQESRGLFE